VASRVTVRLTGVIGLDDADHLLGELAKETGLDWREERPADGKHLAGAVVELLLTAVISGVAGKGAEAVIGATADHVREVVSRWRDRRLDPPDAEVVTQDVPEEQVAGNEPEG
jgi:hypothetical protein